MTHFAKIDKNNNVVAVTVGSDSSDGKEAEISARTGDTYKQTSYNTHGGIHYDPITGEPSEDQSKAFRKNYAGIGYTYDEVLDAFIPPRPFDSWTLDEQTCLWAPPVPRPQDGLYYNWSEDTQAWIQVEFDEATQTWIEVTE